MSEWSSHSQSQLMTQIVDVRYTDLEQEKVLCEELLAWATAASDSYAQAFALTYLGDYYIAQSDRDNSEHYLVKAYAHIDHDEEVYPELSMRLHSLLGICREMTGDEQGCVKHYLKAIELAKRTGDVSAESTVLNNLAFVFQNHGSPEEAKSYYLEAYHLLLDNGGGAIMPYLLSNIAELLVRMGEFDEARHYIEECEALEVDPNILELLSARCWCCYFAEQGNREQAKRWAEVILEKERAHSEETLWAFDNYTTFFFGMINVGEKECAKEFFELMEQTCTQGGLGQTWRLEEMRIKYILTFEPEEAHLAAFRNFFTKLESHQSTVDDVIARAMRTQVELVDNISQRETLREERQSLEYEASMDELMQIGNRRYLNSSLERRTDAFVGGSLGIVMLDIDYFKEYNDRYGHLGGDEVLRVVGKVVWRNRTDNIFPCRFGGDEIACLCDGVSAQEMQAYADAVQNDLADHALENEDSPYGVVTLSIGFAVATQQQKVEPLMVLQCADRALYHSKQKGRNTSSQEEVS